MSITDAERRAVVRALNEHFFRTIWNEVFVEGRTNVLLTPVNSRFIAGNALYKNTQIPLPSGSFAVYSAGTVQFPSGLPVNRNTWTKASDILATRNQMIYVYSNEGKLFPLEHIFIMKVGYSDRVLVALRAEPYSKVYGPGTLVTPIYITPYRDSSAGTPITSRTFFIPQNDNGAVVAQVTDYLEDCVQANSAGTILLVNGIEMDPENDPIYTNGDYVDIILDANVVGAYTVDVSDGSTGFYSDKDARYKEILHCPKALNPDNKLITHNTCTLFVRDRDSNRGVYLHRVVPTSVGQITHNDLSVDQSVVDALRGHLGASQVSVHVKVRVHDKDNLLIEESTFLKELYLCSDTDIVRHLRGELDAELSFWKASELEQSGYVSMMFDTPNSDSPDTLDLYVESLGYRTIASVLSKQIAYRNWSTVTKYVQIHRPYGLVGKSVRPLAYLRGRKVRDDALVLDDNGSRVRIAFDNTISVNNNDEIVLYLAENGDHRPYIFTPSLSQPTIDVPFTAVSVFDIVDLDAAVSGRLGSSDKEYKKRNPLPGTLEVYPQESGSGVTVIFGPSLYGKTFVVQNGHFFYQHVVDVSDQIADSQPIVVPLQTICQDSSTIIPLLGEGIVEVYYNGRRLAPGLDYTDIPLKKPFGTGPALREIYICNRSYLDQVGGINRVEIVCHTSAEISREIGFAVDNMLSYDRRTNVWYDEMTRGNIGGNTITGIVDHGVWLEPPTDVDNGIPFYTTTTIPKTVQQVLASYDPMVDILRLEKIDNYFGRQPPTPTTIPIIPASHKIYSVYMAAVISDILDFTIIPADDPNTSQFLAQFASYEYLKDRDPAVQQEPPVNMVFVDAYVHYMNPTVVSETQWRIIQRLAKLTLPNDHNTLGDVLTWQ